ncbi:MAG: hypothetical protein K6G80_10160 [Treponema sp.]|nr:hypothetical protein [Treponema sp.]
MKLAAGILGMLLLIFCDSLYVQWAVVAVFLGISLASRKNAHLLRAVIVVLSVTFFSVLTPSGKVLARVGMIRVTDGAVAEGLHRSAVLIGMVFFSKSVASPSITRHIGGVAGRFLSDMFHWMEALSEQHISLKKEKVMQSIDEALLSIWTSAEVEKKNDE